MEAWHRSEAAEREGWNVETGSMPAPGSLSASEAANKPAATHPGVALGRSEGTTRTLLFQNEPFHTVPQ